MNIEIINSCYDLKDEILDSKEYKELQIAKDVLFNNPSSKLLIDEFNKAKKEAEPAIKYGKYYSDYSILMNNLSEAKTKLYTSKEYKEYKEKLDLLNKMLDNINDQINEALYPKDLRVEKRKCNK